MEAAKAAVKDFMHKAGHHDTTVHEKVAPAVTHETIAKTEHKNLTTAIDKEVHQDHYHTSVQPVQDTQKLPEQHHHNLIPVEHRNFEHDDADKVQRRLGEESGKFRDETVRVDGEKTRSVQPVVAGEHIHHHVHETIQPVVNRSTIEPHVHHTVVPIHEVHHNAAQHHSTSALPAVSMSDFKKQGGVLTGREERYDGFEGEPRSIAGAGHEGHHHHSHTGGSALDPTHSSHTSSTGTSGLGSHGSNTTDSSGLLGSHSNNNTTTGSSGLGSHSNTTGTSALNSNSGTSNLRA